MDDDVLASVRGVVDLSPHEALDEAQHFLTRQGYRVTYRTTTTLTVERQVSDNASGQESIFKLIVMALPQSGGGVRIKIRGNDREAVRDHQAAWLEWSETLPKRETEPPEAAATMGVTRETVGQEAPRPTTAADNDGPQSRYCSNCGHQLAENDRFCANCGAPVHEAAPVPPPEADRPETPPAAEPGAWESLMHGPEGRKRTLTIENTTQSAAMETLEQFFSLDFQNTRDCDLYFDDGSIRAKEVFRTSPLLLVVHIVLTLVTLGLWLVVWVLIELVQRGQREKVNVVLIPTSEAGVIDVRITGSNSWVQTTQAYIRRTFDVRASEAGGGFAVEQRSEGP